MRRSCSALRRLRVVRVGPGQQVQPVEQRAGVGDVAADRRVGPGPGAVAVEPQVQLDQPGHVLDDVLREPQGPQPGPGQLRPDHLVVVERHPAAGLEAPGLRLADVVHQRGQPQHQIGSVGLRARWPARAPSGCARTRPCAGGARRSPAPAPAARAAPGRRARCRPAARAPAAGRARAAAWSARRGPARRTRSRSGRPSPSSPRPPPGPPAGRAGRRTARPASSATGRR